MHYRLLPDILEYLDRTENKKSVSIKELDELIERITINTSLSREASEILVQIFFQELRNELLKGNRIEIYSLGKFYINCPRFTNAVKQVSPKFEAARNILRKLNE